MKTRKRHAVTPIVAVLATVACAVNRALDSVTNAFVSA